MEATRRSRDPEFPDFVPVHLSSTVSDERIVNLEQTRECPCGDPKKNDPRLHKTLDPAERPKVYPDMNDAKSVPHPYTDQISVQSNFDAKFISRSMDLENTLPESQHGSSELKSKK